MEKDGQYSVKLYCGKTDRWKIIEIEDYLPCTSWGGNRPSLLFGKISDGKLCFVLLEKALREALRQLCGALGRLSTRGLVPF